ncbi:N-acetylneuraminate synthase family protein [Roseobacter sp. HKCCD7870]|uniref:N-acetylneuraminate synthase family protein n=1 Tax=Roseobacter sp. HKCCD7870 TaxID=3120343 RepID=UPI0030EB9F35
MSFQIGNRVIGADAPCFVIAEVGINHGGSEEIAEDMLRAAATCGADAVKLQTVDADESYAPGTVSHAEFKGKELSLDAHLRLRQVAEDLGVVLFTTPADFPSLDLSIASGFAALKISSGLLTNVPLLRRAARARLPLIISTGMAEIEDVDLAVTTLTDAGCNNYAILQCTSLYPAPAETLNLRAMDTLRTKYNCPVGFSDHHAGILACVAAVAMGAQVIEKHFTLDGRMPGADHAISIEPEQFARMVSEIRHVEKMRGSGEKVAVDEERRLKPQRHRVISARRHLSAGETLGEEDISLMRHLPGETGLPPSAFSEIIGRKLVRSVARAKPIKREDLAR